MCARCRQQDLSVFLFYACESVLMCFLENHTTPLQKSIFFLDNLTKRKMCDYKDRKKGDVIVKNRGLQSKYFFSSYTVSIPERSW